MEVPEKKGVGRGGKPLLELLRHSEKLTRETGQYYGIDNFVCKTADPLRYDILHGRLLAAVITAREAARQVAASPVTREVAENCLVLFTPEGDAITYSTGIMIHVQCMGRAIKWLIENGYEENPGVEEGDLFECNDMLIGGVHTPDVYTITPIFWESELVGWAGAVTHEMDIGGVVGGCMPTPVMDRFAEGMRLCMEKVGANDALWRHYQTRVRNSVRLPDIWLIDARARASGTLLVRNMVKAAIEEFGLEYYMSVMRELIEEERIAQIARTKERLVPGIYRDANFIDIPMSNAPVLQHAKKDYLTHQPMEMRVTTEGKICVSADGGSGWGYHSMNSAPGAMEGGLQLTLAQTLCYDGRLNSGTLLATELEFPLGTWANPDYPYFATANAWSTLCPFYGLAIKSLGRAFYARGYREEIMTSGGGTAYHEFGGKNQYGAEFGCPNLEMGFGMGARAVADGLETCYAFWNTESDMGNAEVWEIVLPIIYLRRNLIPYSNGFGKFRAGNSLYTVTMVNKTDFTYASEMPVTAQHRCLHNGGMHGGYPGSAFFDYYARDTEMKERIAKKLPLLPEQADPDIRPLGKDSKLIPHVYVTPRLKEGDLMMHRYISGAGGYGDPIERSPELVRSDLDAMLIDPDMARRLYAVESRQNGDGLWNIDLDKTEVMRAGIKKERLKKAIPVKEWWAQTRDRIVKGRLSSEVEEVYADSMRLSDKFETEFKKLWALDDTFSFRKER